MPTPTPRRRRLRAVENEPIEVHVIGPSTTMAFHDAHRVVFEVTGTDANAILNAAGERALAFFGTPGPGYAFYCAPFKAKQYIHGVTPQFRATVEVGVILAVSEDE